MRGNSFIKNKLSEIEEEFILILRLRIRSHYNLELNICREKIK